MDNAKRTTSFPTFTVAMCVLIVVAYIAAIINPNVAELLKDSGASIAEGRYWTLLTSSFVHAGWWHVLLNVPIILYVGGRIEMRYGHIWCAVIYILTAIASDVFFMAIYTNLGYNISVSGASGAKSGLLGFCFAMFVYELLTKGFGDPKAVFKDYAIVLVLIVFEVILSYMPNIAWVAHIGGALAGIVLAIIWIILNKRKTEKNISPAQR